MALQGNDRAITLARSGAARSGACRSDWVPKQLKVETPRTRYAWFNTRGTTSKRPVTVWTEVRHGE